MRDSGKGDFDQCSVSCLDINRHLIPTNGHLTSKLSCSGALLASCCRATGDSAMIAQL